jgi:hypothetical protein
MRLLAAALLLAAIGCGTTHHPIALPPADGVFDYQIGGAYSPAKNVRIVDRDRGDKPASGRYNICYVNAFQTQPAENAWWVRRHADLLLRKNGKYVEDPGWPGERILDTSTPERRKEIADIDGSWFAGCAEKGFQAVEPDNLDSWTRSTGSLSQNDNAALARLLISAAHRHRLAIAQKNTSELRVKFDFAIAEECQVYDECGDYTKKYGRRVYEIEYAPKYFRRACQDHGRKISVLLRDRDVVASGKPGYRNETC